MTKNRIDRIIINGTTSYLVTLPRKWCEEHNLHPGDRVAVNIKMIVPSNIAECRLRREIQNKMSKGAKGVLMVPLE